MTTRTLASAALDPDLFAPETITADTAEFNTKLAEMLEGVPPAYTMEPEQIRRARREGKGWQGPIVRLDEGQDRTIPGHVGDIPIRVFTPDRIDAVYLHLHGGGWVLGRADQQDPRLWSTARHANLAVVSVDYRLAPEHPYPAGPDDCEAAAVWLTHNAQQEFGTDRLTIGGESAGGHLAAVTLLRMRDRHGFTGFSAANLVYGAYDLSMTPSQLGKEDSLVISTPMMQWFYNQFVPADQRRDPDVSPLFADLRDMPPALFTVGTLDPLLDDSLFMYQRWLAAGSQADLAVYPGGLHGFNLMPIEIGKQANARAHDFLRHALNADA